MSDHNIYQQIGGAGTFRRLVDEFYARVEADPELRPLFPKSLAAGKEAQYLFLMQYFGGPDTYSQERGHPRLRMRHQPFAIGKHERDLWLGHMLAAIDATGIAEPERGLMRDYFENAATFMINKLEPGQLSLKTKSV